MDIFLSFFAHSSFVIDFLIKITILSERTPKKAWLVNKYILIILNLITIAVKKLTSFIKTNYLQETASHQDLLNI